MSNGSANKPQPENGPTGPRRRLAASLWIAAALLVAAPAAPGLEVNQASQAELEQLRGIGPALSDQMVEQRARRPFTDWDDLQRRVRGIGAASARRLSSAGLTVGGQPFDPAPEAGVSPTRPAASASAARLPG